MRVQTTAELRSAIVNGSAAATGRVRVAADGSFRTNFDAMKFTVEGDDGVITFMYKGFTQGVARLKGHMSVRAASLTLELPLLCELPLNLEDVT